jgi:penicillin-binding protein-related factor A (putative recombinase)
MEGLYLHAVVVKKPMPLALARLKAQRFIKNSKKQFYFETEDTFRFRNLPKSYFSDFVAKKIDDEITLVLGHLQKKYLPEEDGVSSVSPRERE